MSVCVVVSMNLRDLSIDCNNIVLASVNHLFDNFDH